VFLRDGEQKRRLGGAWADAVDVDVVPRRLAGQRFGEGDQAAFGARINGFAEASDATGIAGDVDDLAAAALHHLRQQCPGQLHRSDEIQRNQFLPQAGCGIPERSGLAPAGAVDEYIRRADLGLNGFREGADRGLVGQIDGKEFGLLAFVADSGGGCLALVAVDVAADDRCPRFRQRLCRCLADAGGSAGNHRDLVFETHGFSLCQHHVALLVRNSETLRRVSGSS
jgi:hypothetical protein